jgi:hypothetical protein
MERKNNLILNISMLHEDNDTTFIGAAELYIEKVECTQRCVMLTFETECEAAEFQKRMDENEKLRVMFSEVTRSKYFVFLTRNRGTVIEVSYDNGKARTFIIGYLHRP